MLSIAQQKKYILHRTNYKQSCKVIFNIPKHYLFLQKKNSNNNNNNNNNNKRSLITRNNFFLTMLYRHR